MKASYDALISWNTESKLQGKKKKNVSVILRASGNNYQTRQKPAS